MNKPDRLQTKEYIEALDILGLSSNFGSAVYFIF